MIGSEHRPRRVRAYWVAGEKRGLHRLIASHEHRSHHSPAGFLQSSPPRSNPGTHRQNGGQRPRTQVGQSRRNWKNSHTSGFMPRRANSTPPNTGRHGGGDAPAPPAPFRSARRKAFLDSKSSATAVSAISPISSIRPGARAAPVRGSSKSRACAATFAAETFFSRPHEWEVPPPGAGSSPDGRSEASRGAARWNAPRPVSTGRRRPGKPPASRSDRQHKAAGRPDRVDRCRPARVVSRPKSRRTPRVRWRGEHGVLWRVSASTADVLLGPNFFLGTPPPTAAKHPTLRFSVRLAASGGWGRSRPWPRSPVTR